MKLACPLLLVTLLFLVTPAFLFPTEDIAAANLKEEVNLDVEDKVSADGSSDVNEDEDSLTDDPSAIDQTSEASDSVPIRKNKNLKPRGHTNKLGNHHGKRRNGNKRRQPNEKKGQKKGPKRPKENHITYRTSSPLTDQFNQAVDEMLQRLSNSTIKESRHGNVTLHLKVANMPKYLRVLPWAYKTLRKGVVNNTAGLNETSIEDIVVAEPILNAQTNDNETAEVETVIEEIIEEEAANYTQGEDEIVVQIEGSEDETTDEDVVRADAEQPEPTTEEPLMVIEIDSITESPEASTEEVVEVEEEDLSTSPSSRDVVVECSSDDGEQDEDCKPTEEAGESPEDSDNIEGAGQPSLTTQPDGSVEFSLQLTADSEDEVPALNETSTEHGPQLTTDNEGEVEGRNETTTEHEWPARQSRHRGRFNKKARKQWKKQQPRNMPRKPNAVVTGLEQLRRVDDVLIGDKDNGMARVIDVPILIGPVTISMKWSALPSMRKARATSPLLPAQLRLVERNGKLVMVHLKPKPMSPRETLVTVKKRNGQALPTKRQSARLVTHLSKEMSRIWNSGFMLHRMGRRLKQMYKNDPSLQSLIKQLQPQAPVAVHHDVPVEKLTLLKSDDNVPSLVPVSTHEK